MLRRLREFGGVLGRISNLLMAEGLDFVIRAVLTGIGAMLVMDGFVLLRKRFFGVPSLDYALVGRWVGHFPEGRVLHDDIARASPIRGEGMLGWPMHYATGVLLGAALLGIWGLGWAERPTLLPALIVGLTTVAAPFFILQPALGAGILASKTPKPTLRAFAPSSCMPRSASAFICRL